MTSTRVPHQPASKYDPGLEEIEIKLLLQGIFLQYGFDFQDYAPSFLKQKIRQCMREQKVRTISALQDRVFHSPHALDRLVQALSKPPPAHHGQTGFFRALRDNVIPVLHTYPFVRVWHVGCSSLAEIYSTAILLSEEGLFHKTQIYVTDPNPTLVQRAQEGTFPNRCLPAYQQWHVENSGRRDYADYYSRGRTHSIFQPWLKNNIVFAQHDPTSDSSFNEFNLILCRHLLARFNPALQARVHRTFYLSLQLFGILAVGSNESLQSTPHESCYAQVDPLHKLYRKIR